MIDIIQMMKAEQFTDIVNSRGILESLCFGGPYSDLIKSDWVSALGKPDSYFKDSEKRNLSVWKRTHTFGGTEYIFIIFSYPGRGTSFEINAEWEKVSNSSLDTVIKDFLESLQK